VASASFRGFEDRPRQAVIIVSELAAETYDKVAEEFTLEALRSQGFTDITREEVTLKDARGILVAVRQPNARARQWALVARASDFSAVVIAIIPEAAAAEAYPTATMRTALTSLVTRNRLAPEQLLAVLPYAIRDLAGFRVMRANPDGNAELTFGPEDTPLPARQPFFAITTHSAELLIPAAYASLARQALAPFINEAETRTIRSEAQRINGRPGYEIVVETRDTKANVDLMVVQWLRFGTSGYIRLLGMARKDAWDEAFPRMRALRDAVEAR
jgi:hypothetical protein